VDIPLAGISQERLSAPILGHYGWGVMNAIISKAPGPVIFGFAAVLTILAGIGPLGAAEVVAHRAIYSIALGSVQVPDTITGADGAMTMELEKTCEGWIMSQDMTMTVLTAQGRMIEQTIRFAGWESPDGRAYRFAVSRETADESESFRGRARIGAAGGPGEVTFKQPQAKTLSLPEDTLFPVAHTRWLIDRALAGDKRASRFVFDGADGQGAERAVAFIGARKEAGVGGALGPLAQRPGWNVRLAFFPQGSRAAAPEYEIEIDQLDNGVATRMVLDFQAFSVVLTLEKIEAVASPSC
jgi:hypothetical protein